jgi:hypothetical protein
MKKTLFCILVAIPCFSAGSIVVQQPVPVTLEQIDAYYNEAREKRLLDTVTKKSRTPFTVDPKKLSHRQIEALNYFTALKSKPLGSGHNVLENKLIAIDVEYEGKKLIVDLMLAQGQIGHEKERELKAGLSRAMVQEMKKAAKGSREHSIAQYIEELEKFFPS